MSIHTFRSSCNAFKSCVSKLYVYYSFDDYYLYIYICSQLISFGAGGGVVYSMFIYGIKFECNITH